METPPLSYWGVEAYEKYGGSILSRYRHKYGGYFDSFGPYLNFTRNAPPYVWVGYRAFFFSFASYSNLWKIMEGYSYRSIDTSMGAFFLSYWGVGAYGEYGMGLLSRYGHKYGNFDLSSVWDWGYGGILWGISMAILCFFCFSFEFSERSWRDTLI